MTTNVDFSGIFDTVLPNVYIKRVSISHESLADPGDARHYDDDQQYFLEKDQYGRKKFRPKDPEQFELIAAGKFLVAKAEIVIKDYTRGNKKPTWIGNETLLNNMKLRVLLSTKQQITNDLRNRRLTEDSIDRYKAGRGLKEQIISLRKINKKTIDSYRKEMIDGRTVHSATYEVSFKVYRPNPKHLAMFAGLFVDLNEYSRSKNITTQSSRRFLFGNFVGQVALENGSPVEQSNIFLLPNGKVWAGAVHFHRPTNQFMAGAFHTSQPHSTLQRKKVPNKLLQDFRILDRAQTAETLLKPFEVRSRKRRRSKHRGERYKKIMKNAYVSEPEYSMDRKGNTHMSFHVNMTKLIREKMQFGSIAAKADRIALRNIAELSEITSIKIFRNRVIKGMRRGENRIADFENRTELIAEASTTTLNSGDPIILTKPSNSYQEGAEPVPVGSIREINLRLGRNGSGIRTFAVSDLSMDRITDGFYSYSIEMEMEDGTEKFAENALETVTQAKNLLEEYQGLAMKPGNSDPETGEYTQEFINMINEEYKLPNPLEIVSRNRRDRQQTIRDSIVNLPWNNAVASYIDVLGNIARISTQQVLDLADILYTLIRPDTGSVDGITTVIEMIDALESQILRSLGKFSLNENNPTKSAFLLAELDFNDRTRAFKGRLPTKVVKVEKKFKRVLNSNTLRNVGYSYFNKFGDRRAAGHKRITNEQMKDRFSKEHSKYFNSSGLGGASPLPDGANSGLNLDTNYFSYLTPSKIFVGDSISLALLDRGQSLYNYPRYDRIISARLSMNPRVDSASSKTLVKTDPFSPEIDIEPPVDQSAGYNPDKANITVEEYVLSNTNSAILATAGIVAISPAKFEAEEKVNVLVDGENEDNSGGVAVTEMLGENTKFATEKADVEDFDVDEILTQDATEEYTSLQRSLVKQIAESNKGLFASKKRPSIKKIVGSKSVVGDEFDEKENSTQLKARFFRQMPNQLKSLFLSKSNLVNVDWDAVYNSQALDITRSQGLSSFFYLNFEHVNKIEVLVGFQKDDRGEPQVSSPVYRTLNRELLNSTERRSRELLCRMKSYSNKVLKTQKSEKLKMSEYDEAFFITQTNQDVVESELVENQINQQISDFVTPDTQGEELETTQAQELSDGLLSERLVEYSELNAIGRRALKSEVFRTIQENRIPPEFQSNLVVFQPKFVSRIGTNFGATENSQRNIVTTRSGTRSVLARRLAGRSARTDVFDSRQRVEPYLEDNRETGALNEAPMQQTSTSQTTRQAATTTNTSTVGGSYSGGSSGGSSGGGY
tara:strand:- start:4718 stop:8587 length:3870 start_codon:yes stop_codon:yes gene_type:complete